ncbi:sensor histidine kinase [Kitasatospora sp. RB6PN24]|uniref:sensor histidine kinase n=1 Tax=Kitasatospora humi TaxID=2893891 RepID=UPI001E3B73CE|nr:sensor histidine kinase [Kitasatospora humi]MCC9309471.1 sensor histidine kinase [Kitasatospora humi]
MSVMRTDPAEGQHAWSIESPRALAGLAALLGLAVLGLVTLAAPVALLLANLLVRRDPGSDYLGLWALTVFSLVPCAVVGLRWVAGQRVWASGAVLAFPPATALAAVVLYQRRPPGADHGAVWLALPLLLNTVAGSRWIADRARRLFGACLGVPIASPYRPAPASGTAVSHGQRAVARAEWLLTDPATWRDVLWVALNSGVGAVLVAAVSRLVAFGARWHVLDFRPGLLIVPLLVGAAARFRFGWRLLRSYGLLTAAVLGPSKQAELAQRVDHLAQTRAATIDSGAAEMRRIERDLHDGAQARLVALGMTLNAAEQLFESSPEAARSLLTEAKDSSVRALNELRALVRGIHPPVLADRGLVDAVHALALDLPLRIHFTGDLAERPPTALESAAYFAVSELLANVTKHAAASQVWIEVGHTDGMLRVVVTDDGRGGADPALGTGLRGVERRLAAFDGVLAISSPSGGPTIATLEIPCELSSLKTSFY